MQNRTSADRACPVCCLAQPVSFCPFEQHLRSLKATFTTIIRHHGELASQRLPPELRNLIYEYALTEDGDIPSDAMINLGSFSMSTTLRADNLHICGLPRICKEIRAETYGLYFATNKLILAFDAVDMAMYGIRPFVDAITDRIRLIPREGAQSIRRLAIEVNKYNLLAKARSYWWEKENINVLMALLHPSTIVYLHLNIHFAVGEYPDRRCMCDARVTLPLHKPLTLEDEVASRLKEIVATESGIEVVQGMNEIKSSISFLAKDLVVALSRSPIARGT
ncbi:hypothetical protein LTR86_009114 [Recurvomyces mirabilis]|nr:hypothetical protein LTR86_009114 [Recurvomyces mirabilis]